MGHRYQPAKHQFRCQICGRCFDYSTAYEKSGNKPEICADCSAPRRDVMRFETKTRIVEAEQYRPGTTMPEGVKLGNLGKGSPEAYVIGKGGCVSVTSGDWIFKDVDGAYVVYPDDVFKLLFRAVA